MEHHSGLNIVDLVVFATILLSGALALWRGLVRELLSLAAWVGAALVTIYFYPSLRPWMHQHIKSEFGADAATGLALFCGALIILIPIGYVVSGLVRGRALTAIDRSLGFVYGVARGALVVSLLFLITLWIWPEKEKEPDILAQARTRPFLAYGAEEMKSFLPKDDMQKMAEHVNAMEEKAGVAPPIDQQPAVAVSTTAAAAAPPPAKPADPTPAKDGIGQVIDHLLNTPADKVGKP